MLEGLISGFRVFRGFEGDQHGLSQHLTEEFAVKGLCVSSLRGRWVLMVWALGLLLCRACGCRV